MRLIFTHNSANPPLHKWTRDSRKFLVPTRGREFGKNVQIAYRQPRNLKKILTGCNRRVEGDGGQTIPLNERGSFKCNHCRVSCPILEETNKFRSTNTEKFYNIKQKITCDSPFVIYLSTCRKCKGQYVGKSETPFKLRHSNHKQEIKHGRGGLGQHYGPKGRCSYKDISITLIEQTEIGNKVKLARREQFWQHQLRAFAENGGNAHCIKKELI